MVMSLPPRATSTPTLSIGCSLIGLTHRACAASTHAVGITCHGSSSMPAWKSPFSICERNGSGRDCSCAMYPVPIRYGLSLIRDGMKVRDSGLIVSPLCSNGSPVSTSSSLPSTVANHRSSPATAGLGCFLSSQGPKNLTIHRPSAVVGGLKVSRAWHR